MHETLTLVMLFHILSVCCCGAEYY